MDQTELSNRVHRSTCRHHRVCTELWRKDRCGYCMYQLGRAPRSQSLSHPRRRSQADTLWEILSRWDSTQQLGRCCTRLDLSRWSSCQRRTGTERRFPHYKKSRVGTACSESQYHCRTRTQQCMAVTATQCHWRGSTILLDRDYTQLHWWRQ